MKKRYKNISKKFVLLLCTTSMIFVSSLHAEALAPYELMVNFTGHNQDLLLLQQKQKAKSSWDASGMLQGEFLYERESDNSNQYARQITQVGVDFFAYATPWITGFIGLKYDNEFAPQSMSSAMRTAVLLDRLFVVVGNLDQSPFYGSMGKRYVAFGQYVDYMVTRPLTRQLGRIKARQISVSYAPPSDTGIYATAFVYNGNSSVSPKQQYGGTVGYEFTGQHITANVGIDYVTNIADSEGILQAMGTTPMLVKRIPGVAVHAEITSGPFTLFAEYIGATTSFDPINLGFDDIGVKPRAATLQGIYAFKSWGKQSNIAASYTQTKDTLVLAMPERRIGMTYNVVILKNTIVSLEYLRDQEFAAAAVDTGRYAHAVTAQLAWFF